MQPYISRSAVKTFLNKFARWFTRWTKVILIAAFCSKNLFVVQMGNSGFYHMVFRGRWKFHQVRAIANFSMEEIFC